MDADQTGILASLSVARARGGSTFAIEPKTWGALLATLGGWPGRDEQHETPSGPTGSAGQSFSVSPRVRMAVEQRAMDLALAHFRGLGYVVTTRGKPYDLLCTRGGDILYVEVKGTRSAGDEVLLTPNEVTFSRANESRMALFVVSGMGIEFVDSEPIARGGTVKVIHPWSPLDEELRATGFTCRVSDRSTR